MNTIFNHEDGVRVVRCKNCEYYSYFDEFENCPAFGECRHPCMCSDDRDAHLGVDPDDFCSRGKRKQEEK